MRLLYNRMFIYPTHNINLDQLNRIELIVNIQYDLELAILAL